MPKYEIYQRGNPLPLTIVEASCWYTNDNHLIFQRYYNNCKKNIAIFNWCNIAGFKEITE